MRKPIQITDRLHNFIKRQAKKNGISIQNQLEEYIKKDIDSEYNSYKYERNNSRILPDGQYTKNFIFWLNFRDILDLENIKDYEKIENNSLFIAQNYSKGFKKLVENDSVILAAKMFSSSAEYENKKNKILKKLGETYIVKTNHKNIYKIGQSTNAKNRVKSINGIHLFTFCSEELEKYLLDFYSNRVIYLSDDNIIETENIYLSDKDILDISIGLREYILYENKNEINNIVYTENNFFNKNLEEAIKEIYIPNQQSEQAKRFAYQNIATLINMKALGCSGSKYKKDNNIDDEVDLRDVLDKYTLKKIDDVELDIFGYIKYAGITDYEILKEKIQ